MKRVELTSNRDLMFHRFVSICNDVRLIFISISIQFTVNHLHDMIFSLFYSSSHLLFIVVFSFFVVIHICHGLYVFVHIQFLDA